MCNWPLGNWSATWASPPVRPRAPRWAPAHHVGPSCSPGRVFLSSSRSSCRQAQACSSFWVPQAHHCPPGEGPGESGFTPLLYLLFAQRKAGLQPPPNPQLLPLCSDDMLATPQTLRRGPPRAAQREQSLGRTPRKSNQTSCQTVPSTTGTHARGLW